MKKFGLGFLAFMCGMIALAGFSSFFRDLSMDPGMAMRELLLGIVFCVITILVVVKTFGRKVRIIPETRQYTHGNKLPIVSNSGLILRPGEICHAAERAQVGILQTIRGSVRKSYGARTRGMFGSTYSGTSRSRSVSEDVLNKSAGMFYVTSQRIVMTAPKHSFEEPLESVTAVTPYANSFDLQTKHGNYTIFLRDPVYISRILQAAASQRIRI